MPHLVYLKAGVPLVTVSMPHAWIPGPTDRRQATASPCPAVSRRGWEFICEWGGWPRPRATCPRLVHPSTGKSLQAETDSVPHTGCFGDK